MAIVSISANSSTNPLSRKLRELGRLKPRSDEKLGKEFEIIHTPDRPTRLVTPIEAPTEEECGDEIARWQRASAKARFGMFTRGQYRQSMDTDDSAAATESDEDGGRHARCLHVTNLVYGKEVGRGGHIQQTRLHHNQLPPKPTPRAEARAHSAEHGKQQRQLQAGTSGNQHGNINVNHALAKAIPTPAPLFAGTPRSLPPTNHPRSVGPALAAVTGDNGLAQPRYTGMRMEIYRRGFCPYCRKFFGHDPLPLACPYLDCKRDLRKCFLYPNRREADKAPPRLAQRAFLNIQPRENARVHGQGVADRQAVPSLAIEAPTPTDEQKPTTIRTPTPSPPPGRQQQQRISVSPSHTIRTIWPSPLGIYDSSQANQPPTPERQRYMEKPLPPPPPPPPPPSRPERRRPHPLPHTTRPESISKRHRQLYQQPQQQPIPIPTRAATHAASRPSIPTTPPSPLSGGSTASHGATSSPPLRQTIPASRYRRTPPPPPPPPPPPLYTNRAEKRPARLRASPKADDADFLVWKRPEELAKFERAVRENGDAADLFMDIIRQYEEIEWEPGLTGGGERFI